VCFVVCKTISELEHAILITLYFAGAENTNNYRHRLKQPMDTKVAKDFQSDKLQYLLAKVNCLVKDVEA
jgi:hypothetical protein